MKVNQPALTQARLHQLLEYCPETGNFTWLCSRPRMKAGSIAGGVASHGYVRIRIDGIRYRAHRLVWLYVFGEFPKQDIDHINGVRDDNRISNLRACTRAENNQNAAPRCDNTTGYPGIQPAPNGRWRARIRLQNKRICLGYFDTREQAVDAYLAAKSKLHTFQPVPRWKAAA